MPQMSMKKKKSGTKRRVRVAPLKTAEVSAVGKLIRQMGSLGGGAIGSYVGMPAAGSVAGNSLGAAISRWLGYGDYTVSSNTIVNKASTGVPMMHKEGQTVTIRHREFIATVSSSTGFTLQRSFQLNPGNSNTFPWLSTVANSFQEYRFKGVVFHYIPTSGNAISGTSPSLGSVMLQTSYRSNDSPPSTKSELLNEYWSGEAVPSETFAHPIECNPAENPFNIQYVRSGDVPPGDNQLFYDLGVTHLCTQGQLAAGNVLGDLWVTYEVELKKPIVASNVTSSYKTLVASSFGPSATLSAPFTGLSRSRGNITLDSSTGNTFTLSGLDDAPYAVTIACSSGVTGGFGASPTFTNALPYAINVNVSSGALNYAAGAANVEFGFRPIDPTLPVRVTFGGLGLTGTFANCYVAIAPAPPAI